jgi:lipopolysaccharide/colanic/teichoic acid biosynthesis glycosyltransferase
MFYRKFGKRILDLVLSIFALILFTPLLITVAVLVRFKLGSPIIFKQERPGLNEKIFYMYKFRTMTSECDENGQLLPDLIRLTRFGAFLRTTSLDELPELWNIVRGDMSIIGPRPLLVHYLPLYSEEQKKRHLVRPGLTGLAQVNGRNALSWEEKFNFDVQYINEMTLLTDLKIIIRTIIKVVDRDGINSNSEVTMAPFTGTNNKEV